MARAQFSARVEASTLEALDAYAQAHGMTRTAALEALLEAALGGDHGAGEADREGGQAGDLRAVCDVLRQSNADLRATVSTLTAQLAEKDGQIAQALTLADHAQALQAAQAREKLLAAAEAVDVRQDGEERKGWRARLARWIGGTEA